MNKIASRVSLFLDVARLYICTNLFIEGLCARDELQEGTTPKVSNARETTAHTAKMR
jgi:hypothetical protein